MEIKNIQISEVKPYEKNPRKNEKAVEIVAKSIKEFGFKVPIILDKNNEIIAGHTRLKAAIKLEMKEVPVIWAKDLTEEQVKAFRIMDNKSTERSDWDWELLKGEFESMTDLSFTGFSEAEIDKVMNLDEDFTIGKKDPKYQIEIGEVWQLGKHRVICGDATKPEIYEKLIEKKDIHLVFTDPPYGVSYQGMTNQGRMGPKRGQDRKWDMIEGDDLRGDELYDLLKETFDQVNEHLIQNGSLYVFHSSSNQIIFEKAMNAANFQVKQQLIWNKHHVLGRAHYHWCHEPLFYACRINESPIFYGTRANRTILNKVIPEEMTIEELRKFVTNIKKEGTVWDIKKEKPKNYIHPTQKPTKLAERAIVNSSKVGENVLDMFGGSGSTLMACEEKKRNCYIIELDPVFCSLIIERWEKSTGNQGVKL